MGKNFTYLLGMLITIIIGTILYFNLCSDCIAGSSNNDEEQVVTEQATPPEPEPTSYPFAIANGNFDYSTKDNFNFDLSSANLRLPVSEKVDFGIYKLKDYLAENAGKVINITGLYSSKEANNTAFPNLGLARANDVKNYLVKLGIPSSKTNTFGQLKDELLPLDGILLGPVNFNLADKAEDESETITALLEKIKANPLIVYFETGEASINLSAEQRQKVADIAQYLDKVEGAKCLVIGHTDNTGSRTTNISLAKDRADFVKSYLVRNGILENTIESSSKGPDSPIATNDTEEGRALNRRVEVTLN